ncbi:MAG: hypothetical protein NPMRTH1_1100005 [Nitrosopumilales archaeon]|nr:MAG: hypothetical protein NPMRTH1_1100005 [Nitrosopumilales archaeon]
MSQIKQVGNNNEHESSSEKLKNYLTPIGTYADLLSQEKYGKLLEPQKEKIELIKEQIKKITNYLETIKNEGISQPEPAMINYQEGELKLNVLKNELREMLTQATLLKEERGFNSGMEKMHLKYDINTFSKEITKIQKKSLKTLIVHNNKNLCKIFETYLIREGHDSICAFDGRNALPLIENEKFDAVLLALTTSDFSGNDIIDALEKKGKLKENNIVVLSSIHLSQSEIEDLLERGVYSYLRLPVKPDVLVKILETI